jgi:multiple sugar transport system ATP-binding protein
MLHFLRPDKMAEVILKNIKKVYDKNVVAVHDFSLDIADKEFVVLVGPSGCGKSTLLRMIAGLEEISGGELYIDDHLVNSIAPKDRDIAMVFQNYALYPHMTVYDNLAFSLQLRKLKKEEIKEKVLAAANILGIESLLGRKPKELSGGQRQRVAIGRAIVRHPKVFLMDEPLSNLDAKLRNQMRAELIKLHKQVDTTFIYVTHDQTEAMTLGQRIVVMKDGLVQQIGTPHEVFHSPANLFVAGFIGSPAMNFFPVELMKTGNTYSVTMKDMQVEVTPEQADRLNAMAKVPKNVIMGVRPENFTIVPEGKENSLYAKMDVTEMMGSDVHIHVEIDGKPAVVIARTVDVLDVRSTLNRKESIQVTVCSQCILLFDTETGIRL